MRGRRCMWWMLSQVSQGSNVNVPYPYGGGWWYLITYLEKLSREVEELKRRLDEISKPK